jgi:hypothetical protein
MRDNIQVDADVALRDNSRPVVLKYVTSTGEDFVVGRMYDREMG